MSYSIEYTANMQHLELSEWKYAPYNNQDQNLNEMPYSPSWHICEIDDEM